MFLIDHEIELQCRGHINRFLPKLALIQLLDFAEWLVQTDVSYKNSPLEKLY